MSILESVAEAIDGTGITTERFAELIARYLASGIIVRDESETELRFYDDTLRVQQAITDYFEVARMKLIHERESQYFRLYLPGAQIPGLSADETPQMATLRARLSTHTIVAALALRFLYQKSLEDGKLSDTGEAMTSLEEILLTMVTQFRRPELVTDTDRRQMLAELRRHRMVHFKGNAPFEQEDALIAIRPTILGILSEATLQDALEAETSEVTQGADDIHTEEAQ